MSVITHARVDLDGGTIPTSLERRFVAYVQLNESRLPAGCVVGGVNQLVAPHLLPRLFRHRDSILREI